MDDAIPDPFHMIPTYDVARPARWRGGLIVASPHSGRFYPEWFLNESSLSPTQLRSSEDAFVDYLAMQALACGAVVLTARFPRALVDLNRAQDDLDPDCVAGTARRGVSARAQGGLGVIPRVVGQGQAIRRTPVSQPEARRRIVSFWHPYHAALDALMGEAVARFGQAVLIDLHSMPRAAVAHMTRPLPDAVLGDRHGCAAGAGIVSVLAAALHAEGLVFRRNDPFSGAYILERHGDPSHGRHAVQLELDRGLYMNETRIVPHDGMTRLSGQLSRVFAALADMLDPPAQIAAE